MVVTRQQLEAAALAAHARGDDWRTFWPTVAGAVAAAEPWNNVAYRRIVARLSHLLTCGDLDGQRPVDGGYGRPLDFELEAIEFATPVATSEATGPGNPGE